MDQGKHALWAGLRDARTHFRWVGLHYGLSLLVGLPTAVGFGAAVHRAFGRSLRGASLSEVGDLVLMAEFLRTQTEAMVPAAWTQLVALVLCLPLGLLVRLGVVRSHIARSGFVAEITWGAGFWRLMGLSGMYVLIWGVWFLFLYWGLGKIFTWFDGVVSSETWLVGLKLVVTGVAGLVSLGIDLFLDLGKNVVVIESQAGPIQACKRAFRALLDAPVRWSGLRLSATFLVGLLSGAGAYFAMGMGGRGEVILFGVLTQWAIGLRGWVTVGAMFAELRLMYLVPGALRPAAHRAENES
jgi:hypothetical protein